MRPVQKMLQKSYLYFLVKTILKRASTIIKNHAYWHWRMFDNTWRAKRFSHIFAVGILAAAPLGIAAAGFGGSSVAYAEEEPCLGVVGETVEE